MELILATSTTSSEITPSPPALEPAEGAVQQYRRRFATMRVVVALMLREMSSAYGRSPGGYIWALIEPLGMIAVMAVGFSLLMRNPPLGNSFFLFYATGYLPFTAARQVEIPVSNALTYSRPLLLFPAVTWVDAVFGRFFINAMNQALFTSILLMMIFYSHDSMTINSIETIVLAMLLAFAYGISVGVLTALLIGLFPVWRSIWRMVTRPLFLASGVIYTFELLPTGAQDIIWWNPLIHITGLMRRGMYTNYPADYISVSYVLAFCLVTLAVGVLFLSAYAQDIISDD